MMICRFSNREFAMKFSCRHALALLLTMGMAACAEETHPPIPVRFTLEKPGSVSLVIETKRAFASATW